MNNISRNFRKKLKIDITLLIGIITMLIISFSCDTANENPVPKGELQQFRFTKNLNKISVNSDARISDAIISIFLPVVTDITSLIPEFEVSDNSTVKINGQQVTSGEKAIDFSGLVELIVIAEDQTEKVYDIKITTNFESLDNAINNLMNSYNVPGLQLAITKDEKLVYTKSFGYADADKLELVNDNSIFRIASISKPVTALTILKLMEKGGLQLEDKIFGNGAILGEKYGTLPYSEDKKIISVRNLLEHKSGWTNDPFDPMFSDVSITQEELINDMLDNRPLQFEPGTSEYYSNFGYCLLGRVIEEITNKSYEDYVKEEILLPLGISNMKIGKNTLDNKFADEVIYYDQEGFSPYMMNISRMDSPGGWLASSKGLVRLLVHVDRNNRKTDILNSNSINNLYFGFENWWFSGSLPGTSSVLSRVDDTFCFAIIVNTRTIPIESVINQMRQAMTNEVNYRNSWPQYDLFENE